MPFALCVLAVLVRCIIGQRSFGHEIRHIQPSSFRDRPRLLAGGGGRRSAAEIAFSGNTGGNEIIEYVVKDVPNPFLDVFGAARRAVPPTRGFDPRGTGEQYPVYGTELRAPLPQHETRWVGRLSPGPLRRQDSTRSRNRLRSGRPSRLTLSRDRVAPPSTGQGLQDRFTPPIRTGVIREGMGSLRSSNGPSIRDRPPSRSREQPLREGYIGATGGRNGFPLMGGYCGGETCADGGQSVGLANGVGTGSRAEFERRRRTGQNEDLAAIERIYREAAGNVRF